MKKLRMKVKEKQTRAICMVFLVIRGNILELYKVTITVGILSIYQIKKR